MRILAYFIELLVLAFIVTAVVRMNIQPHVNVEKIKQEADSSSNANLDNLNLLLEDGDTTSSDSIKIP